MGSQLGKWIMVAGLALVVVGGLFWLLARAGLPLGQLPGDFHFERGNLTCFFPLASMLLLSLLLTLAINLLQRLLK
jgi:hypothetical protein